MSEAFQIREAVAGDAAAIAALHVRSWLDTYGHAATGAGYRPSERARIATWSQRLAQRSAEEQLLVTVRSPDPDDIVGFIWAGPTTDPDVERGRVAQIRSVHVDPRAQRRGVGRALLREAAARLSTMGYLHLTLWVVDDNTSARAFYERLGWQPDGATRREELAMPGEDGPTVTVVRYRLELVDGRGEAGRG